MKEYGEPWDYWYGNIVWSKPKKLMAFGVNSEPDPEAVSVHDQERNIKRAVDCANAFDGCPDPKAFIETMKKIRKLMKDRAKDLDKSTSEDTSLDRAQAQASVIRFNSQVIDNLSILMFDWLENKNVCLACSKTVDHLVSCGECGEMFCENCIGDHVQSEMDVLKR